MIASASSFGIPPDDPLHAGFLALLPRIETHARIYFRHVKCAHRKADAVAETVALAWKWFIRLVERGKDAAQFVTTFASLAARAVKSGRRIWGQESSRDALSGLAQHRRGFTISPLPDGSSLDGNIFDEALIDNIRTPPDEQAAFRIDFPDWLLTLSERDRRVVDHLIMGERTMDVARRFGLSPARISRLRREFHRAWLTFCDELPARDGRRGARPA